MNLIIPNWWLYRRDGLTCDSLGAKLGMLFKDLQSGPTLPFGISISTAVRLQTSDV